MGGKARMSSSGSGKQQICKRCLHPLESQRITGKKKNNRHKTGERNLVCTNPDCLRSGRIACQYKCPEKTIVPARPFASSVRPTHVGQQTIFRSGIAVSRLR